MRGKVYRIEDCKAEAPNYHEAQDRRLNAKGEFEEVTIYICDACGKERVVGADPYCPHGGGFGAGLYDPFTPYVDPHLLPASDPRAKDVEFNKNLGREIKGVRITSREQRRALMKEQGLDWAGRSHGTGGMEV